MAAILTLVEDDDLEYFLLSRSPHFRKLLSKSRKRISAGKGASHDEFWRKSGICVSTIYDNPSEIDRAGTYFPGMRAPAHQQIFVDHLRAGIVRDQQITVVQW